MKTARILVVLVVMALALGPGCGGVDEPNNAPAKCEALRSVYCARLLVCEPGQITMAACEASFSSALDCGRAVGVTASYDRCVGELPTWDCGVFDHGRTLPKSCDGAIQVSQ